MLHSLLPQLTHIGKYVTMVREEYSYSNHLQFVRFKGFVLDWEVEREIHLLLVSREFIIIFGSCLVDRIRTLRGGGDVTTRFLWPWNVNSTKMWWPGKVVLLADHPSRVWPVCRWSHSHAEENTEETGEWSGPWILMSLICITYSTSSLADLLLQEGVPLPKYEISSTVSPSLLRGGIFSQELVRHGDRSSQLNLIEFIRLWLSNNAFVTLFINSTPTPIPSRLIGRCWSVSYRVLKCGGILWNDEWTSNDLHMPPYYIKWVVIFLWWLTKRVE